MATVNQNLSDYDPDQVPSAAPFRFGIVVSEWNREITDALCEGAYSILTKHGATPENILVHRVPGSFELPLGAQFLLSSSGVDAVICLGSVVRGETAHFDYVCQAVSQGTKDVSLKFNKPVIFGVLTDDHIDQSRARSGGVHGNKGNEAAVAAIKMVALKQQLSGSSS